jgi:hypothetical protein
VTDETHYLAGGRRLEQRRNGWILLPDERYVAVAVAEGVATVTDPDNGSSFTAIIVDQAAGAAGGPLPRAARKRAAARPSRPPGRWQTLNTVVDGTMRDLSEAELRVWLILFREVRDGLARAGMTDIARRAGMSRRGVVKAVKGLKKRGMLEVATRGTVNGSPNTYRVSGAALVNGGSLGNGGSLENRECQT